MSSVVNCAKCQQRLQVKTSTSALWTGREFYACPTHQFVQWVDMVAMSMAAPAPAPAPAAGFSWQDPASAASQSVLTGPNKIQRAAALAPQTLSAEQAQVAQMHGMLQALSAKVDSLVGAPALAVPAASAASPNP